MWFIVGLLLLLLNVGCAFLNGYAGAWWMLPVNAVGIYFAIKVMENK